MTYPKRYFFCGIGGSGMLPLALILHGRGHEIAGSDRSLDQGRSPEKFDYLRQLGMTLHPQDGSGLVSRDQILVASAAIEDTVPDIAAALRLGLTRISRAALLAELFNSAGHAIGVAGTSGKSTVTGMIGWILHQAGRNPTVMNGAVMKNFVTPGALFASALVGTSEIFVSEVDESDGSIAAYNPRTAILNNIALDHKSMAELRRLFTDFTHRADTVILNLDNDETAQLAGALPGAITYGLQTGQACLSAHDIKPEPTRISFTVRDSETGAAAAVILPTPGRHNVSNALAAIGAAQTCGVDLASAAGALSGFTGIRRRFEIVGTRNDITVIDDFGHNPDKIAATLQTLHDFPGRLLVMFQPQGFGPLRKMKAGFISCFSDGLAEGDILLMPDPVYFGGTVDRTVSSPDITAGISANGRQAEALWDRAACGDRLLELAQPGDRIIIMGARDDTLSDFAAETLGRIGAD